MEFPKGYKKKFKKETKEIPSWKLGAEIISKFFGKPVYFLFYKYPRQAIYEAYQVCVKKNKPFKYFLGVLKKYGKDNSTNDSGTKR